MFFLSAFHPGRVGAVGMPSPEFEQRQREEEALKDMIREMIRGEKELDKEDEEEYLEHMVRELRRSLKRGKSYGTLRRAEEDLAELDMGSVHKVKERDVYKLYDTLGQYRGKLEIGAVGDAVSVGTIYGADGKIEPGFTAEYFGWRRLFRIGLDITVRFFTPEDFAGVMTTYEHVLRDGYGLFLNLGAYLRFTENSSSQYGSGGAGSDSYFLMEDKTDTIHYMAGARKYFDYPGTVTAFLGGGVTVVRTTLFYYESEYSDGEKIKDIYISDAKASKGAPFFQAGIQFTPYSVVADLGAMWLFVPEFSASDGNDTVRYDSLWQFEPYLSLSMSW